MSESFQEFCMRILPVVQAGADGKAVEFFCVSNKGWFIEYSNEFSGSREYRIAEPEATPLPITPEMWAMINPKYQWAYFQHGYVIFTTYEPERNKRNMFVVAGGIDDFCQSPLNIDTTGIIPELSLTKRPPDNYVIDNDVDVGNAAALSFSIMGLPKHASVDATHYATSIAGNHVDLYKRDPLNKEQWMTWDYQNSGWIKVQLFGVEPNPIK